MGSVYRKDAVCQEPTHRGGLTIKDDENIDTSPQGIVHTGGLNVVDDGDIDKSEYYSDDSFDAATLERLGPENYMIAKMGLRMTKEEKEADLSMDSWDEDSEDLEDLTPAQAEEAAEKLNKMLGF